MKDNKQILNELQNLSGCKKSCDFAEFLGISPQTLSNWKSRGGYDTYLLISKFPQVNEDYIKTGEGDMIKSNINQSNFFGNNYGGDHIINDNMNTETSLYKDMHQVLIDLTEEIKTLHRQLKVKDDHITYCLKQIDRLTAKCYGEEDNK